MFLEKHKHLNRAICLRFSENTRLWCGFCIPKTLDHIRRLRFSENGRAAERPLSGRSGCWDFNINSNGGGSGSVNSGSSSYRRLDEARTLQVSGNPPRNAVIAILNGHKYKTQTLVCTSMARHRIAPLSLCWTGWVCVCCCCNTDQRSARQRLLFAVLSSSVCVLSLQHPCLWKTTRHCIHHIWQSVWQQEYSRKPLKTLSLTVWAAANVSVSALMIYVYEFTYQVLS